MASALLRSGNPESLLALGENGQPVYASALQIRETLRLKNQQIIADCLAIPQPNELGDRIDWYAPFHGKITSWNAASDGARASAIHQLEACRIGINALIAHAAAAENTAMQRFAALLGNALQFPDSHYIYLVNGKPIVTFWGFVTRDTPPCHDVLDSLRASVHAEVPFSLTVTEPNGIVSPPAGTDTTVAVNVRRTGWKRLWLFWPGMIAVVSTLVLASLLSKPGKPSDVINPSPVRYPAVNTVLLPVTLATLAADRKAETLPPAPAPERTADNRPETVALDDSRALVMPPAAVKIGSTAFLNGSWRVTLTIAGLPTGNAPGLKYRLYNGKGIASILQADGIRCKADITSGLMRSGKLVINSRYTARCSDKSRYRMPEIICKATPTAARCEAHYGETVFPITIKREGK
ncbi:hypothetical protein ED28_01160 [[Pantoea] beijingensis]|uniref:SrfA n=1 Tax=[Pantoea] beijingensis TaxID=1324864 RepID=A0A443IHJ6_9GAMM|nr:MULTISPECIES: SrfA family protein [Erwiniaceae]RWR03625.1 hypothetical protein ED28_01160 [[Pantoea] beijingensis]